MAQQTISDAKAHHEGELLALPNVTGVGIGERAGKPVIKVYVSRKVPAPMLSPDDRVPASLEGFEVDVEEIGFVEALNE